MRTSQLKSLTDDELNLLLYVVNVSEPISSPPVEITPERLLWIKHDALLWKLSKQESKLTEDGKKVFSSLMVKLNVTSQQELENKKTLENTNGQLEFSF